MPVLSYVHQLFNADQCQAYIHTLRWKDRPLQCPRCQSHNVGPWGAYHYQPGLQRYRCKEKDCKRTFNDLTGTLLDGSKRSVMHWILATFLLGLSCSSRRIARELGVHGRTSYRWSWWLRNTASPMKPTASWQAPWKPMTSTTPPVTRDKRRAVARRRWGAARVAGERNASPVVAIMTRIRPVIIAWVNRQGAVVIQATRDFTVQTVQKAADLAMQAGSRLYEGVAKVLIRSHTSSSKFIAIDEQPNDQIVHVLRLGETNRAPHQPLDPRSQINVFALNFLSVALAHPMLCGVDVPLVGPPPIRVIARNAKRLQHGLQLEKHGILSASEDVG